MVLFFSGNMSQAVVPEHLIAHESPAIMQTFHDFHRAKDKEAMARFRRYQTAYHQKRRGGDILVVKKGKK